jgi:hypothetical protein
VKDERSDLETPTEMPRPKDVEQAKAPVPREGQSEEALVPQIKAQAKKSEAPARSMEVLESSKFEEGSKRESFIRRPWKD